MKMNDMEARESVLRVSSEAQLTRSAGDNPTASHEARAASTGGGVWKRLCHLEDIPRLGARVVKRNGCNIAVFRNAEDEVFALDDRCPHKGGPLSQGIVFGGHVACPLHNWSIGLSDGKAVAPDEGCTRRHEVKVEQGEVFLLV